MISALFRPRRSPMCPKISPPRGRARNPTQKVPKAARVPSAGETSGKKSFPKTSAEADPYT
ncbi:hypothetical protein BJ970_004663 [Saccharopolyspora phatthalungensis]|uniref:Uncharacterized protein n=1 Tax=Saccharopolyspora phatthalungensis TaxID=664693 RepID=A0A840QEW4_9PSEU|nr:hypothetical protein [Saccharopolyspora phatthalungensis]